VTFLPRAGWPTTDTAGGKPRIEPFLLVALALVFAMQLYLVLTKSVNWDEFFYFNHIQELRDGTLARPLQAIHTRYLGWLFELPLSSIDQLLVGRLFMLACEAVTALAIFGIARRFAAAPATAALCALTYLTAGYVFLHGFAFRTDPQATAVLMSALWLLGSRRLGWARVAAIAFLLALAGMITIKAVFYAPAFIGIGWLHYSRSRDHSQFVLRCAAILVLAGLFFAALFFLHGSTLAAAPVARGGKALNSAWETVFSAGLLPQAGHLARQMLLAPHLLAMLAASPFLWRRRFPSGAEKVAMAGLLLPLATIIFYRNSYPYFFVFILAPAVLATIPVIELLAGRLGAKICASVLTLLAALLTIAEPRDVLPAQKAVVSAVRETFPRPVVYLDFCGFVGDFPRALPFLTSGWGLNNYRIAGEPLVAQAMARQPIPLLIVNHDVLDAAVNGRSQAEMLLPRDAAALRGHYVPHWGPMWVAGKRIPAGNAVQRMQVAVPGVYTLEGAAIVLDGRKLEVGDTIFLARGPHSALPHGTEAAILRWGDHLPVPRGAAPSGPLYTKY
jgi:hypothetical protein